MTLGFLILVHKNASQCCRLIDSLINSEKTSIVLIHVDLKANDIFKKLEEYYVDQSRVKLIAERYNVHWGSFNQVKATFALIQEGAKYNADYFSFLSGQDFPVKSHGAFVAFLNNHKGSEFITGFKLPDPQWTGEGGLNRMNLYWRDVKKRKEGFFKNKLNAFIYHFQKASGFRRKLKYNYYGGANWFTLSLQAIKYIATYVNENPLFLESFRYSRNADEIFVQSVLFNSEFKDQVIYNDLRFIDWNTGPESPRILRIEDFDRLVATKDKFFARKFDESIDLNILNKLDEYIKK